jgi:chromate transporter
MEVPAPTFGACFRAFAYIGLNSFGGPAGQIAVMHRVLVDEKRWLSEPRFLHALNFCMLLPGPEAMQLATYSGWLLHGTRGGLMAGLLFVLPGAVAMWALSMIYAIYREVALIDALFFGLQAAVLAIIAEALIRIGRRALKDNFSYAIAATAFAAIFLFGIPFPAIIAAAAFIGWWRGRGKTPDANVSEPELRAPHAGGRGHALRTLVIWGGLWAAPVLVLLVLSGPGSTPFTVAWYFSKAALVTFGGAYAVLAYIAQQGVEVYGWLLPGEMGDALALAETTPGPLILVTQFVGFAAGYRDAGILPPLLAGSFTAFITLWVTFAPCFLWIFLGAPYVERLRHNTALAGALAAITAAVAGVILNLAVWFALHSLFGEVRELGFGPVNVSLPALTSLRWDALALTAAAFVAVFRFHAGILIVIAGCGLAGVVLRLAFG